VKKWYKYSALLKRIVEEFTAQADRLVIIMVILEKKTPAVVEKDAIGKINSIATAKQFQLQESQRTNWI
jgi:hypothetical protein